MKEMTETERKECTDKMFDFLMKETPERGCMVCKVVYEVEDWNGEKRPRTNYFLIEKKKITGGYTFIINGRFWYDYDHLFNEKWKIIYKHYDSNMDED